jgi:hypothetical protein
VLVLSILRPHDPLARPTPPPERQTTSGQSRGVGREEPWRSEGTVSQSQVGAAAREVSRVGRVMADGTDEVGAYAARMDEWVAWETVEGAAPRGEG